MSVKEDRFKLKKGKNKLQKSDFGEYLQEHLDIYLRGIIKT